MESPPPELKPHQRRASSMQDFWSEGATEALVESWAGHYGQLRRGNVPHIDWHEVADAVNVHQDSFYLPRFTDVQCKNRLDSLERTYRSEMSKHDPSSWRFFPLFHRLLNSPNREPISPSESLVRSVEEEDHNEEYLHDAEDDHDMEDDDDDGGDQDEPASPQRSSSFEESDKPLADLARLIDHFGEVYERVEMMKQRHMMEMERHRLEFAKDMEIQRMKTFLEVQLQFVKMKPRRLSSPTEDLFFALVLFWGFFMAAPAIS